MKVPKSCTKPRSERAVLIFADSLPLDLERRKWPGNFRKLLALPFLEADECQVEADLHLFTSPYSSLPDSADCDVTVHLQQDRSFARNLEAAVEELSGLGYQEIVIVGRDCPDLDGKDIETAFRELGCRRLVVGPDHRGGVYLIAFHARDGALLRNIQWQRNTDCAQLIERFGPSSSYLLPVKQDLDNFSDLKLLAHSSSKWSETARRLLSGLIRLVRGFPHFVENSRISFERLLWQLPPPFPVPTV